jgi:hypothetical protein
MEILSNCYNQYISIDPQLENDRQLAILSYDLQERIIPSQASILGSIVDNCKHYQHHK